MGGGSRLGASGLGTPGPGASRPGNSRPGISRLGISRLGARRPHQLGQPSHDATAVVAARARRGGRRPPRGSRASRNAVTVLVAAVAFPLWAAGASAQLLPRGLANPPSNILPTHAMDEACGAATGPACQQAVLDAIDKARAAEGVGPLVLPTSYGSLSLAEQLLVLANLERVDRGLPGFAGLSDQLDGLALSGANANNDPAGPAGTSWGSNWAGGEATALLADFDWMYDDGVGSPNMDCSAQQPSGGCWDHRQNILGNYGPHPSMGAAATTVNGVSSMTEVFSSGPAGHLAFRAPAETISGSTAPIGAVSPMSPSASGPSSGGLSVEGDGYLQTASDGAVFAYGKAGFLGSVANIHLARPVVGVEATPGGTGYWEVAADGGVFSFGRAKFYGSAAPLHLSHRVVGMAVPASGKGYWLATSDGGVYSFGDARFLGAPAGRAGDGVVAIAPAPKGDGYWLATKNGAVYSFGDAKFYGPRRRLGLSSPIVGMAVTHGGHGYWLVTKSGRVYAFGDAESYGSALGKARSGVVGIAAPQKAGGYYLSLGDGTVLGFGFGRSTFAAREVAWHSREHVVGIAAA